AASCARRKAKKFWRTQKKSFSKPSPASAAKPAPIPPRSRKKCARRCGASFAKNWSAVPSFFPISSKPEELIYGRCSGKGPPPSRDLGRGPLSDRSLDHAEPAFLQPRRPFAEHAVGRGRNPQLGWLHRRFAGRSSASEPRHYGLSRADLALPGGDPHVSRQLPGDPADESRRLRRFAVERRSDFERGHRHRQRARCRRHHRRVSQRKRSGAALRTAERGADRVLHDAPV